MLGGAASPGGDELLTVTVVKDEHGYGMKVSGDNPVYVQSVKEHGAAWRAGLRSGDRILRVDNVPVEHHSHQQVVQMIRATPTTVLTVQQNTSRLKTPITAPVPANLEKQRQFEASKVNTIRLMLEKEQKYIRDLRNELLKVPDVRKQAEMESAELRCSTLQHQIDGIMAGQPTEVLSARRGKAPPAANGGFLSGLPRSLSNLTGQSLRNLRQARKQDSQPGQLGQLTSQLGQLPSQPSQLGQLKRQNSDESDKRRHAHSNTVPLVPTTCLDNASPPPLPPRSIERPKRSPISPNCVTSLSPTSPMGRSSNSQTNLSPTSPMARPSNSSTRYYKRPDKPRAAEPMHRSMPCDTDRQFRRSSNSLDGADGPLPNSIALQMSYPLVNAPPPPLLNDNRIGVPVLHVRSRSSPEQLDHELSKSALLPPPAPPAGTEWCARDTPPPGTPPPPYHTNTQPCADPQRAIISMEEDDSPASDNSTYSGLFSNLRSVRESKVRTAVLLNWLLGERRCACACLLLVLTDAYRSASGVACGTLRRWAYEIHSAFLMPHAVLQLNGVDENMANEIEHVLVNEYDKEELLRNVFRKARQKAKEELANQLSEFQVKRQVGLGTLYGPGDDVIHKCHADKIQEQLVVERVMTSLIQNISSGGAARCGGSGGSGGNGGSGGAAHAHSTLLAALVAAAHALHCRPAAVAAAAGGARASFLQRDKLYKQRVKQITKQHPQPFVVRGHHLTLQALTSVAHCHRCDLVLEGLAPQAYVCTDCKLRVHRSCARQIEEGCCLDGDHHNNRISRFMERIHNNQLTAQDSTEKKSRKASSTAHFLNMERSFRKAEDDTWDQTLKPDSAIERRDESDESLYESADGQSDAISASDDALPRLGRTPTMSKESLKLAITDEEGDGMFKKGHRKAMSLSNPIEMVKTLGDEWLEAISKKDLDKNSEKKKSRESLWSEEDRDSIHGSTTLLDQIRRSSRKEDKSQSNSRKSSNTDAPKTRKSSKGSSVSSFNFLRRKKTPTSCKPVEVVPEDVSKALTTDEVLNFTKLFLEGEQRHSSIEIEEKPVKPPVETDTEDEAPTPKPITEHRRRLSRQTSRSKSKVRGKSQSLKVNTLRKSHSGTLKKGKKKNAKTPPSLCRSRQASLVEQTPIVKKKHADVSKQNSWLFSGNKGESKREGSNDEPTAPDADVDTSDANTKEPDKDNTWRVPSSGRGVNRAESCRDRERELPRRGKHRNASDPNRLTAHNNHDLEPGAPTAPSGSSSSSSLSSRSNESNTVAAEQHASQSDLSEEDEPLATQWADSIPPHILESLGLSARLRKRQEVIHELIVSEGSHLRWLKVLGGVFLKSLEGQPSLLPPEDLRALFPNLPSVKERHARLYGDLRALRTDVDSPLVDIRGVADAMLNTLGDSGYAPCLARFCRGQRMALEALRERRRKNKELHGFLSSREQLPLCGRLQLRDLLACVWQRLTKYQLLLEGVAKTISDSDGESEEDVSRLTRALTVAKEVLHSVDTAIRTAENEHRLRSIQSKLEVRLPSGPEWDELRRLDLTHRTLKLEGELSIKNDSNKKIHVLALMLEECLVLLQREGERLVLKPLASTSQHHHLSPLIKWDKVLFRPNAAVRHTFFLMNINGVQMHELSAGSAIEYATWVKHIQEAPLAKLTELKPIVTPTHQPTRATDDSGINVSRNPSDASEKSLSTADESERDRTSAERSSIERERDGNIADTNVERERDSNVEKERQSVDKEEKEVEEEKHKPRRPTEGRIVTHSLESPAALEPPAALTVVPPASEHAATAERVYTEHERLRRLDSMISRCLQAKAAIVGSLLHVPAADRGPLADLAVADALGEVDVPHELRLARGVSRSNSTEEEDAPDIHQLLLAACTQANQLTSLVRAHLTVDEATAVSARQRCGACAGGRGRHAETLPLEPSPLELETLTGELDASDAAGGDMYGCDQLDADDVLEGSITAASLAARVAVTAAGLQRTLSRALVAAPRSTARADLAALREENDRLRAGREHLLPDEISFTKADVDPTIQDQPSNGG